MFKSAVYFILPLLLISPLSRVRAQNNATATDTVFGFDPVLYNGRQYTYLPPGNSTGDPFLFESFQAGWVKVLDRTYNDLNLNYDIVNQVPLLKYTDQGGARVVIEVSDSWLHSFGIGDCEFELRQQGGIRPVIYQVIESGRIKVLYHFQKELNLENVTSMPVYAFSRPKRFSSVDINGKNFAYEKNRDFVKAFNENIQVNIKTYLKTNKIKVNKSSDATISSLVNYCNTLLYP